MLSGWGASGLGRVGMRAAILVATGLGLALCADSEAQVVDRGAVLVVGIGNRSCADWLSNYVNENFDASWIAGYWTGANAVNPDDHKVGHTVDAEGFLGEVKKYCKNNPSELLAAATAVAYGTLQYQKR
jgi:hypothetical protein